MYRKVMLKDTLINSIPFLLSFGVWAITSILMLKAITNTFHDEWSYIAYIIVLLMMMQFTRNIVPPVTVHDETKKKCH